jgi:hypothetical protein
MNILLNPLKVCHQISWNVTGLGRSCHPPLFGLDLISSLWSDSEISKFSSPVMCQLDSFWLQTRPGPNAFSVVAWPRKSDCIRIICMLDPFFGNAAILTVAGVLYHELFRLFKNVDFSMCKKLDIILASSNYFEAEYFFCFHKFAAWFKDSRDHHSKMCLKNGAIQVVVFLLPIPCKCNPQTLISMD